MNIYDCFTFYNELELLELRLESLHNIVDYFVIVESTKTHNNEDKPLYLVNNQNNFLKYANKIIYITYIPNKYYGLGDWSIENGQRNAIIDGLNTANPTDLIMISDLDEFPSPEVIININQYINKLKLTPLVLEQDLFYYYFNLIHKNNKWNGTVITLKRLMLSPQNLRNLRNMYPRVKNGGWHFSYMGGVNQIITKMNAIVEGKLFITHDKELININHIKQCMQNGTDIYNRPSEQFVSYDVNNINLPYLKTFINKYPYFIKK